MSGKKSGLSPEQIAEIERQLEWNRVQAADAESRGQTDTCYHTDVIRLTAALKAAGTEKENDGKLD